MTLLINAVSAKSGGAETYLRNVIAELANSEKRHRYLFCIPSALAKDMKGRWDHVAVMATDIGLGPAWKRFLWDQTTLRRIAKKERADILVSSSDFGMLFPPCRQILMIRNPLFFSALYQEKILPVKSSRFKTDFLLRRWLIKLSARSADLVVTASESMLNDVRRFISIPESRCAVNPFGVALDQFGRAAEERPTGGPFRLLYVSEYGDYKNLTTLLKALLLLESRGMRDLLLTITMGPDQFPDAEISTRQTDKVLLSDERIAARVKRVGPVPYGKIAGLYRESDLFVFPSLAESFGHPLAEAMASSLPVIASDLPLCREICGEAALYFDPLDPKALAEKILLLQKDPALRKHLGQAGKQRAESLFKWEDHVERLVNAFERVARNRFSHSREKAYYSRRWPQNTLPYEHLEPYLRCWMKPEEIFAGNRVLDVGAGECTYTRLIAEKFSPKEIVACDLFRERMLPALKANRNRRLKFAVGDCFRLPFKTAAFDVAFGSFILHQLPDLEPIAQEIRRVLPSGGIYVGIEPNPFHPLHLVRYLRGKHSPNQYLLRPRHLDAFRKAGFEVAVRYFFAGFPWLRSRFGGTCMGIVARRREPFR